MAIIKPARKFVGSDLNSNSSTKYIKPNIKQVLFNKKDNKDGAHLYFLPPYTTDCNGNGVWYKVFTIRDNFGDKFKEKYAVKSSDVVDHFERNFKLHFPEESKPQDTTDEKGHSRKVYPLYGRKTSRVIYNVAYANKLELGNHILDLPVYMGASQIMDWLETKLATGKDRPMLNDPAKCIPVFIKLKDGGSGNPWQITPDTNDPAQLPDDIADSDNLYNLDDDVLEYKVDEELIAKLKSMYKSDIFDLCMDGWPGIESKSKVQPSDLLTVTGVDTTPKKHTTVSSIKNAVSHYEEEDNIPMGNATESVDFDGDDAPEVVSKPAVSKEAAAAFLRRKVNKSSE